MSGMDTKPIGRPDFPTEVAGAVVLGAEGLPFTFKEALAAVRATGRPVLTARALNAAIPASPAALRRMAGDARWDLKGFIRQHFTLTPLQERRLAALSLQQTSRIYRALDMVVDNGYRLQVRMPGAAGPLLSASGGGPIVSIETDSSSRHEDMVVTIVVRCIEA